MGRGDPVEAAEGDASGECDGSAECWLGRKAEWFEPGDCGGAACDPGDFLPARLCCYQRRQERCVADIGGHACASEIKSGSGRNEFGDCFQVEGLGEQVDEGDFFKVVAGV